MKNIIDLAAVMDILLRMVILAVVFAFIVLIEDGIVVTLLVTIVIMVVVIVVVVLMFDVNPLVGADLAAIEILVNRHAGHIRVRIPASHHSHSSILRCRRNRTRNLIRDLNRMHSHCPAVVLFLTGIKVAALISVPVVLKVVGLIQLAVATMLVDEVTFMFLVELLLVLAVVAVVVIIFLIVIRGLDPLLMFMVETIEFVDFISVVIAVIVVFEIANFSHPPLVLFVFGVSIKEAVVTIVLVVVVAVKDVILGFGPHMLVVAIAVVWDIENILVAVVLKYLFI